MFRSHLIMKMLALAWLGLLIANLCGLAQVVQNPDSLTQPPQSPGEQTSVNQAPLDDWLEVFFTIPDPNATRGGPDGALAAAIDQAQTSVDMAAYDLNLWSVRDALLAAHQRGVRVRLVTESENDTREVSQLEQVGIPVVRDNGEGLMHHKFTVIDGQEVWTGSMNYTLGGAYRNHENLLRLRSPELAALYTIEFEEMYTNRRFGERSLANTPAHILEINGVLVEVYFSPDDGVAGRLVELLEGAQESIVFMAFSFTNDDLADAILDQAAAGITIAGVMDAGQIGSNTGGDFERFTAAGLDVFSDASAGAMHHKVLVIDERIVVTGSYNFSRSAETRNDENVVIIDHPEIANLFLEEFQQLASQANP